MDSGRMDVDVWLAAKVTARCYGSGTVQTVVGAGTFVGGRRAAAHGERPAAGSPTPAGGPAGGAEHRARGSRGTSAERGGWRGGPGLGRVAPKLARRCATMEDADRMMGNTYGRTVHTMTMHFHTAPNPREVVVVSGKQTEHRGTTPCAR